MLNYQTLKLILRMPGLGDNNFFAAFSPDQPAFSGVNNQNPPAAIT
jgi:hypothetical protein